MTERAGLMTPTGLTDEERQIAMLLACCGAAVGLMLNFLAHLFTPAECTAFMTTEFYACGAPAVIATVGELVASVSIGVLALVAEPSVLRRDGIVDRAGLAAAVVLAVLLPARLLIAPELLGRLIAGAWTVLGIWLLQRGALAAPQQAGHARFLGATAVVWGLAQVLDEAPRPLPVGGLLFAVAFVVFALRLLRSRASSQRASSQQASGWLGDSLYALRVAAVVFFGFPVWVSCTFAEPLIGDPAIRYQVVNTTDHQVDIFINDPRRAHPIQVAPGGTRESGTLDTGTYSVVATAAGADVYCAHVRASDLRRLHNRIVVSDAPASCR
jgi:hypothetical protein